jgi:DNA-binding IclR family transcriptional regulator
MTNGEPKRLIQSVGRALQILEYVAVNDNEMSLSAISRGLGLNKSTVFSLISTLEQMGYVQQNQGTGKYSLGLKLFELGQTVHSSMDLRTIAMPHLCELSKRYGETVHLSILSKGEVVYIDKVDSSHSIRIASQVGGRNPAYCTGVGKVLLAGLPDEDLAKVIRGISFKRFTAGTITDGQALRACIDTVRRDGYATDMEEFEIGLNCVAAPIRNYSGAVIAAISLSGPTHRIVNGNFEKFTADVIETARLISAQLGHKG